MAADPENDFRGRQVVQVSWTPPEVLKPDARAGHLEIEGDKITGCLDVVSGLESTGIGESKSQILVVSDDDGQLSLAGSAHWVVPGFIDIHRHGAAGVDIMQAADDPSVFEQLGRELAREGVTAYLATTVSAPVDELVHVLRSWTTYAAKRRQTAGQHRHHNATTQRQAAVCCGIHLEGPFLNPSRAGAQNPSWLVEPSPDTWHPLFEPGVVDALRLMTLAPELPGALDLIHACAAHQVVVAAGHTEADWQTMEQAARAGMRHVAHLFNGMMPMHHRRPGVVGAGLLMDEIYAELICDGQHVAPQVVRLFHRSKPPSRRILVTDAILAAGLADGTYTLGGLEVAVHRGVARLPDGTLAGSTLSMDDALRNYRRFAGCGPAEAVRAATVNPAALLSDSTRGTMGAGTCADLVVLNDQLEVVATVIGGRLAYLELGTHGAG